MPAPRRIRYVKTSPAHSRETRYAVHLDGTLIGTLGPDEGGRWHWTHTQTVPTQSVAADRDADHTDWEANRKDATVSLLATAGLPRGVAWSVVSDDMDADEEPFVADFLASLGATPVDAAALNSPK